MHATWVPSGSMSTCPTYLTSRGPAPQVNSGPRRPRSPSVTDETGWLFPTHRSWTPTVHAHCPRVLHKQHSDLHSDLHGRPGAEQGKDGASSASPRSQHPGQEPLVRHRPQALLLLSRPPSLSHGAALWRGHVQRGAGGDSMGPFAQPPAPQAQDMLPQPLRALCAVRKLSLMFSLMF